MQILDQLREDYRNFPLDQTFSLYAEDVYFKDPLTSFRGLKRYQSLIQFMKTWFKEIHLELQDLQQTGDRIESRWILSWTAPVPWQPKMQISGRSELHLNPEGFIASHFDYWDCSGWDVFMQLWRSPTG
jgi:hypothetical protein